MTRLSQKIMEGIRSEGPINFQTFMETALYHPELGYYMNDSLQIGREGDFYTSPHMHPFFGAMIGRQLIEMWNIMGKPSDFTVVEMGAGLGFLAKDVIDYLKKKPVFKSMSYKIIELNPRAREKQQALLSEHLNVITWHDNLKELGPVKGCFLSNELLDSFPVRLVEINSDIYEIFVSVENNMLAEIRLPCSNETREYLEEFAPSVISGRHDVYRTEVNLRIRDWIKGVASKLTKGFVLTIDYGYPAWDYYRKDRNLGTLLCYLKHKISDDPLVNVGMQDITAHVNFSAFNKWAEQAGFVPVGFCPQGTYLISLGIDDVIAELCGDKPDLFDISKIKNLILPQGMGDTHKVMIHAKGITGSYSMRGFLLRNQLGEL
ncbi:MAG: SAM-dependent methyltransferase [Nitrospiraceae bacterium]|nr:SAM-dependent methyltransferase [Nitrospiraceae bacterium]